MTSPKPKAEKPARKGHPGKSASPWSRGPNCDTPNAGRSFRRYVENGKAGKS